MFESSWDTLKIRKSNKTFWLKMIENFNWITQSNESSNKKDKPVILKPVDFSNLSPSSSVPPRLSKEELKKLKFHGEINKSTQKLSVMNSGHSYTQALVGNVKDILKFKENFLKLSNKKIKSIKKMINDTNKSKPHINMTTKSLSYKQVIISMSTDNIKKFMEFSSNYVANINRTLKNIKSDTFVNFICSDHWGLIITTNKMSFLLDMNIVENYIKNVHTVDASNVQTAWLPQLKSYLKILGTSYIIEGTDTAINSGVVKLIIKSTHIFKNIHIAHVIKVLPKSDIAIIWINIWSFQNKSVAKTLINYCYHSWGQHESWHLPMQGLLEMGTYYLCMQSSRI